MLALSGGSTLPISGSLAIDTGDRKAVRQEDTKFQLNSKSFRSAFYIHFQGPDFLLEILLPALFSVRT